MPRHTLFRKMVLLLVMMLVPIVGLYYYSNRTSTEVLGTELNQSNANQLSFFQTQVNTNIDLFSLWPNLLIQDPDIFGFKDIFLSSEYFNLDIINVVKRIQTKLNIQESSSNWKTKLYIFSPSLGRVVSDNDVDHYDNDDLKKRMKPGWQVKKMGQGDEAYYVFSLFTAYPYSSFSHPEDANLIIELQFESGNIQDMLDKFKSDGRRDPVYFKPGLGVIYNRSADKPLTERILRQLQKETLQAEENRTLELDGQTYLVNVAASDGKAGRHGTLFTNGVTLINKDMKHPEAFFTYQNYMYDNLADSKPGGVFENGLFKGYDYDFDASGKPLRYDQIPGGYVNSLRYLLVRDGARIPDAQIKALLNLADGKEATTRLEKEVKLNYGLETTAAAKVLMSQEGIAYPNMYTGPTTATMKSKLDYLNKIENQTFNEIIYGKQGVEAFDKFVEQWKASGGDQMTNEVNDWYSKLGK